MTASHRDRPDLEGVRGALDNAGDKRVTGWAYDPVVTDRRLSVELLLDGELVSTVVADRLRGDLVRQGIGDGRYGFVVAKAALLAKRPGGGRLTARLAEGAVLLEGGVDLVPSGPAEPAAALQVGELEAWQGGQIFGWAYDSSSADPAVIEIAAGGHWLGCWPAGHTRSDAAQRLDVPSLQLGFVLPAAMLVPRDAGRSSFKARFFNSKAELDDRAFHATANRLAEPLEEFLSGLDRRQGGDVPEADAFAAQTVTGLDRLADEVRAPGGGQVAISGLSYQLMQDRLAQLRLSREVLLRYLDLQAQRRTDYQRRRELLVQRWTANPQEEAEADEVVDGEGLITAAQACLDAQDRAGAVRILMALLRRDPSPQQLKDMSRMLRRSDLIALPRDLHHLSMLHPDGAVSLSGARHLRELEGWMSEQVKSWRPARIPASDAGEQHAALYCLWRSVPHALNGYTLRSHYLLRALKAIGAPVTSCTRYGDPWDLDAEAMKNLPSRSEETVDDVTYYRLGSAIGNRRRIPTDHYVRECAYRIAQMARLKGARLIHAASNWMNGYPAALAAEMLGLPFVYEVRGLWEVTRSSADPDYATTDHCALFVEMEIETVKRAALVMPITEAIGEELIRRGATEASRLRLAPNGVEADRFAPAPRDAALAARYGIAPTDVVFGFIGTFATYEGLPDLVAAAARLRARSVAFKLLLVGDGPHFDPVAEFVDAHGLRDVVIMTGRAPFLEVPRYYSLIDAAVFPRIPLPVTEMVSPLKPFEAMAMGKLVIGSNVQALAEIIRNGETGLTFAKGDVEALADVMERAIRDRAQWNAMTGQARAWVLRERTWQASARRIAMAWSELGLSS